MLQNGLCMRTLSSSMLGILDECVPDSPALDCQGILAESLFNLDLTRT